MASKAKEVLVEGLCSKCQLAAGEKTVVEGAQSNADLKVDRGEDRKNDILTSNSAAASESTMPSKTSKDVEKGQSWATLGLQPSCAKICHAESRQNNRKSQVDRPSSDETWVEVGVESSTKPVDKDHEDHAFEFIDRHELGGYSGKNGKPESLCKVS